MSQAVDLSDYTWRNRLLVLAAPKAPDPEVERALQVATTKSADLDDRDTIVVQLYHHGESRVDDRLIGGAEARVMREQLGIAPNDHVLLLIGKDGTVKRKGSLATDLDAILRQIDAMPMRREEMRDRI